MLIFSRANIFRYSFVIFLSRRIYSDIHSSNIYGSEYIRIFIRPKNNICPTLLPTAPNHKKNKTVVASYTTTYVNMETKNCKILRASCSFFFGFPKYWAQCSQINGTCLREIFRFFPLDSKTTEFFVLFLKFSVLIFLSPEGNSSFQWYFSVWPTKCTKVQKLL